MYYLKKKKGKKAVTNYLKSSGKAAPLKSPIIHEIIIVHNAPSRINKRKKLKILWRWKMEMSIFSYSLVITAGILDYILVKRPLLWQTYKQKRMRRIHFLLFHVFTYPPRNLSISCAISLYHIYGSTNTACLVDSPFTWPLDDTS